MRTHFRITNLELAPDDLRDQIPFEGVLLRKIAGPDYPDYWLAELLTPLAWNDGGVSRRVTHVVVGAQYVGQTLDERFKRRVVGLAYVTDPSVLTDKTLDFAKCRAIAIGLAERVANSKRR